MMVEVLTASSGLTQTVNTQSANHVKEASLTTERNLFEYLAQQSLSNSFGTAATLANPSALASQIGRHLRGFLERSEQGAITEKGRKMSKDQVGDTKGVPQPETQQLHAGPAREQLTALNSSEQRTGSTDAVSNGDYEYLVDNLSRSMQFMVQSSAVVTASSNVMKSVQTLTRGQ